MAAGWTAAQIPPQDGRVAVITGSNTGLGFETALELARHGATVVMTARDLDKGKAAAARVAAQVPGAALEIRRLDLASLASVREAAGQLRAEHPRIDLLINNGGVMYPPRQLTRDGFELQFGTNHLGHFALTGLLLDTLLAAAGSRVVTVASIAHLFRAGIHFDDLQWERSYSRVGAYAQSKLANLLFTYELQRRLAAAGADAIAVAAHPGGASTDLLRHLPMPLGPLVPVLVPRLAQSAQMGALGQLRAAADPAVTGGQYYGPRLFSGYPRLVQSSRASRDAATAGRLWDVSGQLTGVTYPL